MSPTITIGDEASVDQGVGAAVHADQDRIAPLDISGECLQVAEVIASARHDQRVAIPEARSRLGQLSEREEAVRLPAHVLHRVLGELAEGPPGAPPPLLQQLEKLVGLERPALGDGQPAGPNLAAIDLDGVAVAQPVEHLRAGIDQGDPGPGQDERPEVRIGPVRRRQPR